MLPLPQQIQIACDAAKFCVARLAGVEAPPFADDEKSLADLRQRVQRRRSTTCSRCRPSRSTAATRRRSRCRAATGAITMSGEAYLKHFALPNFFFHVTTTYALLRHNGVELGKMDFLGALPQAGAAAPERQARGAVALSAPRGARGRRRLAAERLLEVTVERGQPARRLGLVVTTRDVAEDFAAEMPELVQRARHGDAVERASAARSVRTSHERVGEVEPRRGERVAARALGRTTAGVDAETRQPLAPSQSPRRDDQGSSRCAAAGSSRACARRSRPLGGRCARRASGRRGQRNMQRRRQRRQAPAASIVRAGRRDAKSARKARAAGGQFARWRPAPRQIAPNVALRAAV